MTPRPDGTYIYPPRGGGQVIENKMEAGTHSFKPKHRVYLTVLTGFSSQRRPKRMVTTRPPCPPSKNPRNGISNLRYNFLMVKSHLLRAGTIHDSFISCSYHVGWLSHGKAQQIYDKRWWGLGVPTIWGCSQLIRQPKLTHFNKILLFIQFLWMLSVLH